MLAISSLFLQWMPSFLVNGNFNSVPLRWHKAVGKLARNVPNRFGDRTHCHVTISATRRDGGVAFQAKSDASTSSQYSPCKAYPYRAESGFTQFALPFGNPSAYDAI